MESGVDNENSTNNSLFEEQTYIHPDMPQVSNNISPNINMGPINNGNVPVDQVVQIVRNICSLNMRFPTRPIYMKLYPEWIDLAV